MHLIEPQLLHKLVHPKNRGTKKIFDLFMLMVRSEIPGGANDLQIQRNHYNL
jgi:hypothetical protein